MTYEDAMDELLITAERAHKAADNEDGAPVHDLRDMVADIKCLIDHRATVKEFEYHKRLYEASKTPTNIESDLRDAGRLQDSR